MSQPIISVDQYVQYWLDTLEPTHTLGLQFGACSIQVQTNSTALLNKLRRYFSNFLGSEESPEITVIALEHSPIKPDLELTAKQPDPGKIKIKEEFADLLDGRVILKRLTGMLFLFGGEKNLGIGPCLENDNQIVNFIINRFIQWTLNRKALLFHAAAVSLNGKGLALSGFSGMGKSTLALHIMNRGVDFTSNDRLMGKTVHGQLQMVGVPKLPRINPGTIVHNPKLAKIVSPEKAAEYLRLAPNELWVLEEKYDAYIDELYGKDKFKLEATMLGIVVLNWTRGKKGISIRDVDLRESQDLIPAFSKDPGLFYEPDEQLTSASFTNDAYISLLQGARVIEISGGLDFEAAADYCYELLKNS